MSKHSRISNQLWELSIVGMMGLGMEDPEVHDEDGKRFLSGDLLLAMESESLDYQDHREIFMGPTTMTEVADQMEDLDDFTEGPITTHNESADDIRRELGWSAHAPFDDDVRSSYYLWDESWDTAASMNSQFA